MPKKLAKIIKIMTLKSYEAWPVKERISLRSTDMNHWRRSAGKSEMVTYVKEV